MKHQYHLQAQAALQFALLMMKLGVVMWQPKEA